MSAATEPFRIPATADAPALSSLLHRPQNPNGDALVLTHGAGANCESALLTAMAQAFCDVGFTVLRFNLPFRQLRPHGPPPRGSAEQDQDGIRRAVAAIRPEIQGRVFLGGHSYGGRQATLIASSEPDLASALLLLSYPLHPPNRPDQLRTAHFPSLQIPSLFVQGIRDGFASIEEITAALRLIPARTELLEVEGAGHELLTKKNSQELPNKVIEAFQRFVAAR